MLVAVISGPNYFEALRKSVEITNNQLAFQHSVQEGADLERAFNDIKRSYVDALVIDVTCVSSQYVYSELKNFRLVKEKARVILVSPGASPGDALLSRLVALGIYDIVASEGEHVTKEVSHLLQSEPKSLAAAWRWFAGPDESEAVGGQGKTTTKTKTIIKTTDKVVEQVVYRDRIIGSVVIAVAGAREGAGSTHFALSAARYLTAKAKKTVALVELNSRPCLETLKEDIRPGPFYLQGFQVFPGTKEPQQLLEVFQGKFNYVILDLGVVKWLNEQGEYIYSPWYQELLRADVSLVTAFGSLWQIPKLISFSSHQEASENWRFILNHCDKKADDVINVLRETGFNKVFANPYSPEPFTFSQERESFFETVFSEFVERKKRKGLLPWQRKSG